VASRSRTVYLCWSVTVGVREHMKVGDRQTIHGVEFVGINRRSPALKSWYRFLQSERPDWWYWRCANHLWGVAVSMAQSLGVRTIFSAALDSDGRPRHALFWRPCWWRALHLRASAGTDRISVQQGGQFDTLAKHWHAFSIRTEGPTSRLLTRSLTKDPDESEREIFGELWNPHVSLAWCAGL
jgi:hypothetical protein